MGVIDAFLAVLGSFGFLAGSGLAGFFEAVGGLGGEFDESVGQVAPRFEVVAFGSGEDREQDRRSQARRLVTEKQPVAAAPTQSQSVLREGFSPNRVKRSS